MEFPAEQRQASGRVAEETECEKQLPLTCWVAVRPALRPEEPNGVSILICVRESDAVPCAPAKGSAASRIAPNSKQTPIVERCIHPRFQRNAAGCSLERLEEVDDFLTRFIAVLYDDLVAFLTLCWRCSPSLLTAPCSLSPAASLPKS